MLFDIDKSDFINIMKIRSFQLPLRWNGEDFYESLSTIYDEYLERISSYLKYHEINKVRIICNRIKNSVKEYHNGLPSDALKELSKAMDLLMVHPLKIYPKNDGLYRANDTLKLYRVRYVQDNRKYKRHEIFHTPYSLRSNIGTSRYSISGYPSLYLATSLELCCEEIKAKSMNDMAIASRYQLNRHIDPQEFKINIIELGIKPNHFVNFYNRKNKRDMATTFFKESENNFVDKYLSEIDLFDIKIMSNYLFWYPLIAACSYIRVKRSDPFASEYIIPQLLMQWIRKHSTSEDELWGIRYFSCASIRASELGLNYVFPVSGLKYALNNNFCKILSKIFVLTQPCFINEFSSFEDCEISMSQDSKTKSI